MRKKLFYLQNKLPQVLPREFLFQDKSKYLYRQAKNLQISKSDDNERTITQVVKLNENERIKEISRMASGEETADSLKNAKTMILSAQKIKREIKRHGF